MKTQPFDVAHLIRSVAIVASVAAVVVVAFIMGGRYLDLRADQNRYSAIDACAQVARVSFESKDEATGQVTRSELPSTDVYKQCLKDKGIEVK